MEGEKEKQWEQREEKDSNEAEDDTRSDEEGQDGGSEAGSPIMHWEALSLCIAELEKQEEEKKAKAAACLEPGSSALGWREDRGTSAHGWEDGNDACNSHVLALTSRLHTQMNLQLCFINDSESEEEEEAEGGKEACNKKSGNSEKRTTPSQKNIQNPAGPQEPRSRGFRNTLRNLRDRLKTDHRKKTVSCGEPAAPRKHWELRDLENLSLKQLNSICASLRNNIQDLSSELVSRLHVRDQLRTEQDAMLLEVQDLTSL
ncbi:PREDICTED: schwannomin-interacting protein 1-like [Cyprinodon variegatus]|uniref:schwannomin-interacting protein 1-like n=1 Tax=Cyprinodon variegatus TaxID=28743 RepID=UPI0007427F48|nr:PREDICTED: schwannomin-interacting protein 1-like [Cyprinodon variegatus]